MTRFASQLIFCSPHQILSRTVVEQDERQIVTDLFSLDDRMAESSHTQFFDGILSAEIISLKQNVSQRDLIVLVKEYQYIDFSEHILKREIIPEGGKILLVDFGTDSTGFINEFIPRMAQVLSGFSVFDLIAACTYYPAKILGKPAGLSLNLHTQLLLWQQVDFANKRITEATRIKMLGEKE